MIRSRLLKFASRRHFQGDLVFLDADTLPVRPITDIWELPKELNIAYDRSARLPFSGVPPFAKEFYHKLGWKLPTRYFNGGVWLAKDTPNVCQFFESWFQLWLQCAQCNCNYDQISLNYLISTVDFPIGILDRHYNAMPDAAPWNAHNAKVLHFFTGNGGHPHPKFLLRHVVDHLHKTGEIDWETIDAAVQRQSPWSPQLRFQVFWTFAYNVRALLNGLRNRWRTS